MSHRPLLWFLPEPHCLPELQALVPCVLAEGIAESCVPELYSLLAERGCALSAARQAESVAISEMDGAANGGTGNGHHASVPRAPLFMRRGGSFHPPADLLAPWLLIGPGTGVAPFRGFLQHRQGPTVSCGPFVLLCIDSPVFALAQAVLPCWDHTAAIPLQILTALMHKRVLR